MEDFLSDTKHCSDSDDEFQIRRQMAQLRASSTDQHGLQTLACDVESPSNIMEFIQQALDLNFKLRNELLSCEKKLLFLKLRRVKKEIVVRENDVTNRNPCRGFLSQFSTPYFKDEKGYGCTFFSLDAHFQIGYPFSPLPTIYSLQENDYVNVAIAMKEHLISEIAGRYNREAVDKTTNSTISSDELKSSVDRLRKVEAEVNSARKKTLWNLLGSDVDRDFDWMVVSTRVGANGLSASECRECKLTPARKQCAAFGAERLSVRKGYSFRSVICTGVWEMVLKPQYRFKKWTSERQNLLQTLAVQNQYQNWDEIAHTICPGLTGYLAFTRFLQTSSHMLTTNGAWSLTEDENLLRVVSASTIGREIRWKKVMYYIEDRSVSQCITRWYKINPAMKRGRFSEHEDALLLHSIRQFGCDFMKISSVFGNRNVVQLRARYAALKTALDDDKKSGDWSLEEDEQLLALVRKYGDSKWCLMAKEMPSRNRVQIRQRYSVLKMKLKENPKLDLQSLIRTKKNGGSSKDIFESSEKDKNIRNFIKKRISGGEVTMRTPGRPGRRPRCSNNR